MALTESKSLGVRQLLLVIGCLSATAASAFWIARTQFPEEKFNVEIHKAIGLVMAKETARLINKDGKVVIITLDPDLFPELGVQVEEFERVLQEFPEIRIKETYELDTHNKPKYSFGSGLSGRRFVRLVNKNKSADILVSFVGAPDLDDDEVAQLQASPKFVAEARSIDNVEKLFEKKVIHAAVVSRFQFPGPIRGTPRTTEEWFDQRYQVLTARNLDDLPSGRGE